MASQAGYQDVSDDTPRAADIDYADGASRPDLTLAVFEDISPDRHDIGLKLIALSSKWEQAFAESIVGQGEDKSLAMAPSRLSEFITLIRERFEDAAREGEAPVLVTSPGVRPFVRSIVERFRTQTSVLSQSEIHPRARLKTVGGI